MLWPPTTGSLEHQRGSCWGCVPVLQVWWAQEVLDSDHLGLPWRVPALASGSSAPTPGRYVRHSWGPSCLGMQKFLNPPRNEWDTVAEL